MLPSTQPNFNDIEVTLLGPGYGESIILHYQDSWIVIDSCKDQKTKKSAAITYLASIDVDLSKIKQVACTHWHDDHCSGFASLYEGATNAELVISGALQNEEFFKLIEVYTNDHQDGVRSGLDEMGKTFAIARSREKKPSFARSNQLLWRSDDGVAELYSLSPSSNMLAESIMALGRLVPVPWQIKEPLVAKDNHIAVAMLFKVGDQAVLLGSDLEESGGARNGWSEVISDNRRPKIKCSLYKVAHHGSETGEHASIWTDLLDFSPITLITPFSKLVNPLPLATDRKRIRTFSSQSFLTTDVLLKRAKRNNQITKLIQKNNLRTLNSEYGAIRCRLDISSETKNWVIEKSSSVVNT